MQNQQMGGNPFGGPSMEAMAAFGFPGMGPNMNQQVGDIVWHITIPKPPQFNAFFI
jgi:hypothetical protein